MGSENLLVPSDDDLQERARHGMEALRILLLPERLTAVKRGTLLVAPRGERDRDVQRVVEDHVTAI